MFLTILVLMIPVLLVTWFFTRDPEEPPVESVDWQSVIAEAQKADEFAITTIPALPEGWRATKAVWVETGEPLPSGDPAAGPTLELGFLSEDELYFAVNQTPSATAGYLGHVTRAGNKIGQVDMGGRQWDHFVSPDQRTHSLVHQRPDGVSLVLVSDAGLERLSQVAGLLQGG